MARRDSGTRGLLEMARRVMWPPSLGPGADEHFARADEALVGPELAQRRLDLGPGLGGFALAHRGHHLVQRPERTRARGRKLYGQRISIVEPVFANLRQNKRLDRFTLRTLPKVNTQWSLYCLVHNIEKLAHHGYGT